MFFAEPDRDYWGIIIGFSVNPETLEAEVFLDSLIKFELPNVITAIGNEDDSRKLMDKAHEIVRSMDLRTRFNTEKLKFYMFMTDKGLYEDEDAFAADFNENPKMMYKLINDKGMKYENL